MKHYNEYKYTIVNDNINDTIKNILNIINYNEFIDKNNYIIKNKLNKIINF